MEHEQNTRTTTLIGLALFAAALVMRFYGFRWGLPQVYEEATPFKTAWDMWAWGPGQTTDLNPHFFNYPSLVIYLQFVVQALFYQLMKLSGWVGSTFDLQVMYQLDKTRFYVAARSLHVLFGAGTVWLTYLIGCRAAGRIVGIGAASLMVLNTFHVSRSQMIEVDVPLTCFVVLSLFFVLRLRDNPNQKHYILAGVAIGLAMSSKYTGAFLVYTN